MARNKETSALVDNLLRVALLGGTLTAGLAAPNSIKLLEKPMFAATKKLDRRAREREIRKTLRYMKHSGLLVGDYDHGLQITDKGRKRLLASKENENEIRLDNPSDWDGVWRMVLYDIPEEKRKSRAEFASLLNVSGFVMLQKSIWIYPYPCRPEIERVAAQKEIDQYITYLECIKLDNEKSLINKFKTKKIM